MSKKRAETRTINVKQIIEKKYEPEDRAEWLLISLTASSSRRDEVFGRDRSCRLRRRLAETLKRGPHSASSRRLQAGTSRVASDTEVRRLTLDVAR